MKLSILCFINVAFLLLNTQKKFTKRKNFKNQIIFKISKDIEKNFKYIIENDIVKKKCSRKVVKVLGTTCYENKEHNMK